VEISVKQVSSGQYWGTSAFNAGTTETFHLATFASGSWSYAFAYSNFPASGSYTVHVRATDAAGNLESSPTATFTITVAAPPSGYTFTGFYAPVDNAPTVNSAKAGQGVPVKWRITDSSGNPISDPTSFVSLTSSDANCTSWSTASTDAIETYVGTSGLQYLGNGSWQFNWSTQKGYSNSCRVMKLTLKDGSVHTAEFKFTK
jgi:hypothetical protein